MSLRSFNRFELKSLADQRLVEGLRRELADRTPDAGVGREQSVNRVTQKRREVYKVMRANIETPAVRRGFPYQACKPDSCSHRYLS